MSVQSYRHRLTLGSLDTSIFLYFEFCQIKREMFGVSSAIGHMRSKGDVVSIS